MNNYDFRPEKAYGSTKVMGVMSALKKVLPGGAVAIALTLAPAAWAAQFTDTIVVIDESGSMGGEHAWIGGMINDLDAALQAAGVTNNQYGLVGYGGTGNKLLGHSYNVGSGLFGGASDFDSATSQLTTSGGFEDGYQALDFALNNYSFREGASVNLILVTDEDRDTHSSAQNLTYQTILEAFQQENNALLNAFVNSFFEQDLRNDSIYSGLVSQCGLGVTPAESNCVSWCAYPGAVLGSRRRRATTEPRWANHAWLLGSRRRRATDESRCGLYIC